VIAEGTHDELMKNCEEFQKLWKASTQAAAWKI
jgi:ATP-binding cassette subfamily B protein